MKAVCKKRASSRPRNSVSLPNISHAKQPATNNHAAQKGTANRNVPSEGCASRVPTSTTQPAVHPVSHSNRKSQGAPPRLV